jgi:hypothetical protein
MGDSEMDRRVKPTQIKRARYGGRDFGSICCALVIPMMLMWACLGLIKWQQTRDQPRLVLDHTQFAPWSDEPLVPYLSSTEKKLQMPPHWKDERVAEVDSLMVEKFFGRSYEIDRNAGYHAGFPTCCDSGGQCPSFSCDNKPVCERCSSYTHTHAARCSRYTYHIERILHIGGIRRVIRSAGNLCKVHRLLVRYSTY